MIFGVMCFRCFFVSGPLGCLTCFFHPFCFCDPTFPSVQAPPVGGPRLLAVPGGCRGQGARGGPAEERLHPYPSARARLPISASLGSVLQTWGFESENGARFQGSRYVPIYPYLCLVWVPSFGEAIVPQIAESYWGSWAKALTAGGRLS